MECCARNCSVLDESDGVGKGVVVGNVQGDCPDDVWLRCSATERQLQHHHRRQRAALPAGIEWSDLRVRDVEQGVSHNGAGGGPAEIGPASLQVSYTHRRSTLRPSMRLTAESFGTRTFDTRADGRSIVSSPCQYATSTPVWSGRNAIPFG